MIAITINRGSDHNFAGTWRDEDGQPMDLSDWAISVFEPHPSLAGNITLAWTNAGAGEFEGRIEWDNAIGIPPQVTFRLRISNNGHDETSPLIRVAVQ